MNNSSSVPASDSWRYMFFDYVLIMDEVNAKIDKKNNGVISLLATGPHERAYLDSSIEVIEKLIDADSDKAQNIVTELDESVDLLGLL